jgi:hypothetical protein
VTNGTERSAAESVKSRDAMMLLDRDGLSLNSIGTTPAIA